MFTEIVRNFRITLYAVQGKFSFLSNIYEVLSNSRKASVNQLRLTVSATITNVSQGYSFVHYQLNLFSQIVANREELYDKNCLNYNRRSGVKQNQYCMTTNKNPCPSMKTETYSVIQVPNLAT